MVYPLDTVKCRLQAADGARGNVVAKLAQMARREGVRSWYRGLAAPVAGYGAINAVAFGTNANAREALRERRGKRGEALGTADLVAAAATAGLAQSLVRAPVERVKTLMQVGRGAGRAPFRSTLHCVTSITAAHGLRRGLFLGLGATTMREVPQYALYYPAYELCRGLLARAGGRPGEPPGPLATLLAGGVAGTVQWLPPIYTLDVVKSRIQAAAPGTFRGFWHCLTEAVATNGWTITVRGLSAALLRAFPLHGCVFLGYELSVRVLFARE